MSRAESPFFARSARLPSDRVIDQEGDGIFTGQTGSGPMREQHRGDKGYITVLYPDSHTYTVETERSGTLKGVQRLAQAPGDTQLLPEGTQVAITYDYGPPLIAGVLNFTTISSNDDTPTSLTGVSGGGADDPLNPSDGSGNYRTEGTPRDIGPSDWAMRSPAGNAIAVLDGGVNLMKSSDFAQIRTHLLNDLVEIISQRFRHITAMGTSEIKNEGGRASYTFRGGTDQLSEAGSDQENWTIRFDLGGSGDLLKFELTQPDGASVFKVHVTPDGKADVYAAKGFNIKEGEQGSRKNLAGETTEVKGDVERTVGGEETHKVRGARNTTVSANDVTHVGNDSVDNVYRHFTKSVGGNAKYVFAGGDATAATPLNEALAYEVVNGSWTVNIGDPLAGAVPSALAGFDLKTFLGDITMAVKTKGDVDLSTLVGQVALKTGVGTANLDGTTVHLGSLAASAANPIIKGTLYTSAMASYLGTNTAAYTALTAATGTLAGAMAGVPMAVWSAAAPLIIAWLGAVTAGLSALLASNATLAGALPGTLSTKAFTA